MCRLLVITVMLLKWLSSDHLQDGAACIKNNGVTIMDKFHGGLAISALSGGC